MKLKNFIIITLLGVVGFVISMVGGIITQLFGAYGIFIQVSIGSLLAAPIYFVMCHKIQKRGTIFSYYLIMGLAYTIMGFLPMLFIMIAAGLIGELILFKTKNYSNDNMISISYLVSQLIYALHGFFFILILGVQGLIDTFPNLFTIEKSQMLYDTFFNIRNMVIILIIQIVVSYIGTLFGKYINNKFFNRGSKTEGILN